MNASTLARLAASLLIPVALMGCSKSRDSTDTPAPAKQQNSTSATTPVMEAVLSAWQHGDRSAAVCRFLETDWNARPLFTPGSTLGLTEAQWKSLPEVEGRMKSSEITAQVDDLKRLAQAVVQAGREAAARHDVAQAAKTFSSLRQCGEALDHPDSSAIVRLLGRAMKKMAAGELANLKQ